MVEGLEGSLFSGINETIEAADGRKSGYVMSEAVSVIYERALTELTLDLALDLELAKAESFDFFSLPVFSVVRRDFLLRRDA